LKCACPCAEEFEPKRSNQVYKNAKHRQRDKDQRWSRKRQSLSGAALRNARISRWEPKTSGGPPLLGSQMAKAEFRTILGQPRAGFDRLLRQSEVSRLLSINETTLEYWRSRGQGGPPFIKLGRLVRYRISSIEEYLKLQTWNAGRGRKGKSHDREKFAKEPGRSAGDAGRGAAGEPRDCAQNRKRFDI
jgi:predicted DNA-binding transcriptional regulator AlpA